MQQSFSNDSALQIESTYTDFKTTSLNIENHLPEELVQTGWIPFPTACYTVPYLFISYLCFIPYDIPQITCYEDLLLSAKPQQNAMKTNMFLTVLFKDASQVLEQSGSYQLLAICLHLLNK